MSSFLFLVGYSGCGKSYLQNELISIYPKEFCYPSKTIVPRPLRESDQDFIISSLDKKGGDLLKLGESKELIALTSFNGGIYYSLYDKTEERTIVLPSTSEAVLNSLNKLILESHKDNINYITIAIYLANSIERLQLSPRSDTRDVFEENCKNLDLLEILKTQVNLFKDTNRIRIVIINQSLEDFYGCGNDPISVVYDVVDNLISSTKEE